MDVKIKRSGGTVRRNGSINSTRHNVTRASTAPAQSGFTLIEAIITLAIVFILTGSLSGPLRGLLASNRVSAQVNRLIGSLAYTRSAAITHHQHAVICKSTDGRHCIRTGGWHQGWIIFLDGNHNRRRDSAERLLRTQAALAPGYTLRYRGFGSAHYLVYRPSGVTLTNGSFVFCPPDHPTLARSIIVYKSGRARVSQTRAGGGRLRCP